MNRTLVLLATAFLLQGTNAYAQNVSAKQWQQYKTWAQAHYPERDVALAVAPNGSHCSHFGRSKTQARNNALQCCKNSQYNPTKATCKIVDVNFKSLDTTVATTTSNSSDIGWCANQVSVFYSTKESCSRNNHGKWYGAKSAAQAEHRRLKNETSTVATTTSNSSTQDWCARYPNAFVCNGSSSTAQAKIEHQRLKKQSATVQPEPDSQPTQTAAVDNSALELEFWKTIKDSNDPDMFREYLRQFPSGTFEGIAKIKIQKLTGSTTSVAKASIPNLDYGNYHALVIGNNQYQNFKDLNTPINDARTVSRILRESYGFKVDVLENATESEMFKAIIDLRSNVGRNDNVLIYFGGHGELDRDTEEGFWIPSDARRDDPSTYIPVDRIRKQIKAMSAKHVMVVADSCFAGSLTRSTLTRALKVKPRSPEYQTELQRIIDKKSRTALTSGGLEPVLDSGGDGHSVFASALISALRDNSGVLDAHELFIQVRKRVRNNSPQNPEYSPIYETGHDHGDFLFVRR